MPRRRPQLELHFSDPRGGARPGAGRPRLHDRPGLRGKEQPHRPRRAFASCHAVHVTQRLRPGLGYLRKQGPAQVLLGAFRDAARGGSMRIAHYSIQGNHLHLIVEADRSSALSSGMQGLSIRVAKRLNARLRRSGPVFVERYHAHILESRRAVANAVRYVAGNYRRHTLEHLPPDFRDPLATDPLHPLEQPRLWLLRTGWQLEPPRKAVPFEPP
jgi:putative transposase